MTPPKQTASAQFSEDELSRTADTILNVHAGLGDFPETVANGVCGVYYRFFICASVMSTHLPPHYLNAFGIHVQGINGLKTLMSTCAEAATGLKLVVAILPATRSRREAADFPNLCEALVDTFVYGTYVHTGSPIWLRRLKRCIRTTRVPNGLYRLLVKSHPRLANVPKSVAFDLDNPPYDPPFAYKPANRIPTIKILIDGGMTEQSAEVWRGMYEALEQSWQLLRHAGRAIEVEFPERIPGYFPKIPGLA